MPERSLLYPLNTFYAVGAAEPHVQEVSAESVPQPYRRLLVHEDDMTPTLEAFHGGQIHLRLLARRLEGDRLARQVVLVVNGSEQPVEFGAIIIHLSSLPPPAREEVLEGWRPLGTILAQHRVTHTSRPLGFFRVSSDAVMEEALGLSRPTSLFGRRNAHRREDGGLLAEIVEILPPVEKDG